jgi:putative toxin-antitoxin system antitoxin component (TIGR02293 family)
MAKKTHYSGPARNLPTKDSALKPKGKRDKNLAKEQQVLVNAGFIGHDIDLWGPGMERKFAEAEVRIRAALMLPRGKKPESQMTALEKMEIVRVGVSKLDLERLKEKTALDYDMLAHALSVTRATLINKKGKEKFNASVSERIVSLADLYSYGYEVFEDEDRFNEWMFRPNKALGAKRPYDLIDNQYGREEVRNVIGRIDYGVYS